MASDSAFPEIFVFAPSEDPALPLRPKPDDDPKRAGSAVNGVVFKDKNPYHVENISSTRRPALSRNSTEDLTEPGPDHRNQRSWSLSTEESEDGIDTKLRRAQTEVVAGDTTLSAATESEIPNKLARANTESSHGFTIARQGEDLGAQITTKMGRLGMIGLDSPKSYLPDEALVSLMAKKKRIQKAIGDPPQNSPEGSEDELITFCQQNPKVFAITLLVHSLKENRRRAMEIFKHDEFKFTDDCLPVSLLSPGICAILNATPSGLEDESDSDDDDSDSSESTEETHEAHSQCNHRKEANSFHYLPWTAATFKLFFDIQWSFQIPKFDGNVFKYHFGDNFILPFESRKVGGVDNSEVRVGGHFGEVQLAMMLANYQTVIPIDKDKNKNKNRKTIPVALKEMKLHIGEEYNNTANWERETKALKVFNGLQNSHTVRGIGAFTQRGKHFILMEWADEGDLRAIWKKNWDANLRLSDVRVAQFLEQFRGLANALNQMHDYEVETGQVDGTLSGMVQPKTESVEAEGSVGADSPSNLKPSGQVIDFQFSKSPDSSVRPHGPLKSLPNKNRSPKASENGRHDDLKPANVPTPQASSGGNLTIPPNKNKPPKATENWRHGDLKPANILSFKDSGGSWLGTLKLADLGRARQHMDKTGGRSGTAERFGTWDYDPPEVWVSLEKERSRFVDIWSFGCVLLESVIWLLFGEDALQRFLKDQSRGTGSLYWSIDNIAFRTAKPNETTFEWIKRLLSTDPECKERKGGSAVRDLILLIQAKLLVIKHPEEYEKDERGMRINSGALVRELDTIINKGKGNPTYLFSGLGRQGREMPEIAQVRLSTEKEKSQFLTPLANLRLNGGNITQNPTPAPWSARPFGGPGLVFDSYIHEFDDEWRYVDDTAFATRVLNLPEINFDQLLPKQNSSILCKNCQSMDLNDADCKIRSSLTELRRKKVEELCEFCALLLRTAKNSSDRNWVEFDTATSGLKMNQKAGPPVLTIRRALKPGKNTSSDVASSHIQLCLPQIPKGGSLPHFSIINAWLDDCDSHEECKPLRPSSVPTRLLDVGTLEQPCLRLVESSSLPENERETMKYIALSYPWGLSPPHEHFVTDSQNVEAHKKNITEKLPPTLADAVKTTRNLNTRYLWIDCLCILQGSGGDFAEQAGRMEGVFSSAYCVLAATSADGTSTGFLNRTSKREVGAATDPNDEAATPVYFQYKSRDGKSPGLILVDEGFDDFERDVLKAPLNQRGWVFQERALARRTIHFTNNQTYFECGQGIRCETLTKMWNTRVSFLGDPNFPMYGLQSSKGGFMFFYEGLYEQYSKLSFSNIEDRPFAISGLEQRLGEALKRKKKGSDRGYWGIFDDYWGRGLLWRRAADVKNMIRLTKGAGGSNPAPSWSWEGYSGGITFMKPEPHTVEWHAREVALPWSQRQRDQGQMTTATYHGDRCLRGMAKDFTLPEKIVSHDMSHDIIYDDDSEVTNRGQLKVLIIGSLKIDGLSREQVRNYVLVLAKKNGAAEGVYERIGAGHIDGSLINFHENVKSVLVE